MKTVRPTVPLDIIAGFGTGVAVGAAVISIESFPPFPYQSLSVHENSRFNEENARFSVKGAKDVSCQSLLFFMSGKSKNRLTAAIL